MKKLILLLILVSTALLFADGVEPIGTGTENDPYQISTLDNLLWLSTTEDVWDDEAYFEQTADIDASDTENWNDGEGYSPIGNLDFPFYGNYNGNEYTITDLYINRPFFDRMGSIYFLGFSCFFGDY